MSTPLIIKSYPIHMKDELLTYNIYYEDSVKGLVQSIILKYPCIREGCMTNCYFQGLHANQNQIKSQICLNCNNKNTSRIYLDIGYKRFLQKHKKYIMINKPLNVQINPIKKQFYFGSKLIKNTLISKLSEYISLKIFDELALKETPAINNKILNFIQLNKQFQKAIGVDIRKNNYYCYSFCKYAFQPREKKQGVYVILFIYGENEPLKVRLVNQKREEFCRYEDYIRYGMVALIGKINTLVLAISTKKSGTEYFISNVHNLNREELILPVRHMREWKDPLGRFNGNLIVDQNHSFIFGIGGFDFYHNDSLPYISCFLNCRWQGNEFRYDIEKSHHLFQSHINSYNTGSFSTVYKNTYNENRITLKNSTFMIYSYNREEGKQKAKAYQEKREKLFKQFYNIGGALKDATTFASGRFATKKPGIRYLTYDQNSTENPIISDHCTTSKIYINFTGNNYILIELPYNLRYKRKHKHHALIFGGQKDQEELSKYVNHDFSQIFILDTNMVERSLKVDERFHLSGYLNQNLDNFSTLMLNPEGNGQYYIRCTFPLHQPIYVKGIEAKNINQKQLKGGYIHFITFEYDLSSSLISFIPGYMPEAETKEEEQQQE